MSKKEKKIFQLKRRFVFSSIKDPQQWVASCINDTRICWSFCHFNVSRRQIFFSTEIFSFFLFCFLTFHRWIDCSQCSHIALLKSNENVHHWRREVWWTSIVVKFFEIDLSKSFDISHRYTHVVLHHRVFAYWLCRTANVQQSVLMHLCQLFPTGSFDKFVLHRSFRLGVVNRTVSIKFSRFRFLFIFKSLLLLKSISGRESSNLKNILRLQRKDYEKIFSSISLRFMEIIIKWDEKIDELLAIFFSFYANARSLICFLLERACQHAGHHRAIFLS